MIRKICVDSSLKDIRDDSLKDELFLASFKKGYNCLSAQVKQELKLKVLYRYLVRYPQVKLSKLVLNNYIIESNFENHIGFLNKARLEILHMENKPWLPEKFTLVSNFKFLKELSINLSRLKREFFKDLNITFPKTLQKLTL